MISYISGMLADIEDRYIVVEAGGVGYGINVPQTLIYKLPAIGKPVKIYTHLQVSEDAQKLYGFISSDDRVLFRLLLGVSGVGPKAALGVLSVLDADQLRLAILSEDEKAIAKAPGLGAKTARKIILELKDKFNIKDISQAAGAAASAPKTAAESAAMEDALQALVSLGYSPSAALSAVSGLGDVSGLGADEILSLALKQTI